MTTGYILIAAILILGGAIATVGDRIGTRVGKARLSLFKLRPRNTAVVATILTGSIISGSTLAILFAADERLRTGVFELEKIQRDLRHKREQLAFTRQQLKTTTTQKSQVENELAQARAEQIEAQNRQAQAQLRLAEINQSLQAAIAKQSQTQAQLNGTQAKQSQTQAQLNNTQSQLSQVTSQFQKAQDLLGTVSQQARALRSEIQQLQNERQQLLEQRNQVKAQIAKLKSQIAQRDKEIAKLDQTVAQRDRDIAERDQVIARRATRLKELETQQDYLEREVAKLERYYQDYQVLRQGNVALERGQVLAAGVVRIVEPSAARQAVEQLLRLANRTIIQFTQPSTNPVNEQVFQIPDEQVEQLIEQIDDGRDYVVRIRSAGNYVLGEKHIQVFAEAALNQVVFTSGEVLAAISAQPSSMTAKEIQQRIELLLGASNFRALRAGILGDTIQIGNGRPENLIRFFEQLKQYNQPVELKAVAAEVTYTSGPLKVELLAVQNGQVVFSTKTVSAGARGALETKPQSLPPLVPRGNPKLPPAPSP